MAQVGDLGQAVASLTGGHVLAVTILDGGSGYTTTPQVTFSPPPAGGTVATGRATVVDGRITGVTITNAGSGYTLLPTISFSITGVTVAGDQFVVLATAGETFVRGGAGNDTITVGEGAVNKIGSGLFLSGGAGQDSVTVNNDQSTASANVQLVKNTAQHDLSQTQKSQVTNALELTITDPVENQMIGDQLKSNSVAYAQQAAKANATDLNAVVTQAANELGSSIATTLQGAKTDYLNGVTTLINDQQTILKSYVKSSLVDYYNARNAYEVNQAASQALQDKLQSDARKAVDAIFGSWNLWNNQAVTATSAWLNTNHPGWTFWQLYFSVANPDSINANDITNNYNSATKILTLTLSMRAFDNGARNFGYKDSNGTLHPLDQVLPARSYAIPVNDYLAGQIQIIQDGKAQAEVLSKQAKTLSLNLDSAKVPLQPFMASASNQTYGLTDSELNAYYQQSLSTSALTAADLLIASNTTVTNALATIVSEINQSKTATVSALDAAISVANSLASTISNIDIAVNNVVDTVNSLRTTLNTKTPSDKWDQWLYLDRLNVLPEILLTNETSSMATLKSMWLSIPDLTAGFNAAATFRAIASPTWQDAVNLFNNSSFNNVVNTYIQAQALAQNFTNYYGATGNFGLTQTLFQASPLQPQVSKLTPAGSATVGDTWSIMLWTSANSVLNYQYTVVKGDTLATIAQHLRDFISNGGLYDAVLVGSGATTTIQIKLHGGGQKFFVDFNITGKYSAFRSVYRNIQSFQTAKQFLASNFQFEAFKTEYQSNLEKLNAAQNLVPKLALQAKYDAQLASLVADKQQIDATVTRNQEVVNFLTEKSNAAVNARNDVINRLKTAYHVHLTFWFGFGLDFDLPYTGDPRYLAAQKAVSVAQSAVNAANAAKLVAVNDQATLVAKIAAITSARQQVANDLASSNTNLADLVSKLDQQYKFLANLSTVAVATLMQTRGSQAAKGFKDTSSLISELLTYSESYTVAAGPANPAGSDGMYDSNSFALSASGNAVITTNTQFDSFDVLSLTGLNADGIQIGYGDIENLTVNLGNQANTVRVQDTLGTAGSVVNVLAGNGDTDVTVSDVNNTTDHIISDLFLSSGTGNNKLLIDDHGDLTGDQIVQKANGVYTQITGMATGNINYHSNSGYKRGLNILTSSGSDSVLITVTHTGSTEFDTGAGNDTINLQVIAGPTIIRTGGNQDTVNISSRAGIDNVNGQVQGITALLTLIASGPGTGQSTLNVDDSGDPAGAVGTLTSSTLTGLGMAAGDINKGISYMGFAKLNIQLGAFADTFNIQSSSAGQTLVNSGGGNDQLNLQGAAGSVTLLGGAGNDTFTVNPALSSTNSLTGTVNLDGAAGNDQYTINYFGSGSSQINVLDSGSSHIGDLLTLNGTTGNDQLLFRARFVALMHDANGGGTFQSAERVNYDTSMSSLVANGMGGNDAFTMDDNSAPTTLNGGAGSDSFRIGQLFGNVRLPNSVAPGDEIDTIHTTRGYLSVGASYPVTANGGGALVGGQPLASTDAFIMYHNKAVVHLNGGAGDNLFVVQAFALFGSTNSNPVDPNQQQTTVNGGQGTNTTQYALNAPVDIHGGPGLNTLVVLGTELNDTVIVTSSEITVVGSNDVQYTNIQVIEVDTQGGNDSIYIGDVAAGSVVKAFGGAGNDHFYLAQLPAGFTADPSKLPQHDLARIQGSVVLGGGDSDIPGLNLVNVLYLNELDLPTAVNPIQIVSASDVDTVNIDNTASSRTIEIGTLTDTNLSGFGMGSGETIRNITYLAGITYGAMTNLNLNLAHQGNILTIVNTASDTRTVVNTGMGTDTVNVRATGGTTTVNTGGGTNIINVGSTAGVSPVAAGVVDNIKGALTVTGSGSDTLNVDDTGSTMVKTSTGLAGTMTGTSLNGLGMGTAGISYNGLSQLRINLGSGGNTFTIASTAIATTTLLNSGAEDDTVNVQTTASSLTVNGQSGNDTINVSSNAPSNTGILAGITVSFTINGGGQSGDTLNVSDIGNTNATTSTLTNTQLTSTAFGGTASLAYARFATLNISMGSGGNTFNVASTAAGTTTTVNGGTGNDTVNVKTTASNLTVNGQSGNDTINVSSNAPSNTGMLAGITAPLTINGGGQSGDTINVSDLGDTNASTSMLTNTQLTSTAFGENGNLTYGSIMTLNFSMGSGGNTFNVASTAAATTTTVNSGTGNDQITVSANAPTFNTSGSTLSGIAGVLNLNLGSGTGTQSIYVGDYGDVTPGNNSNVIVTSSSITGLGGANTINYQTGIGTANTLWIEGSDTLGDVFNVQSTSSQFATTINTNSGNDLVNVRTIAGLLNVNGGLGDDTFHVGSNAPSLVGGSLIGIQALLTINGGTGSDLLNVDDTGNPTAATGYLTENQIIGLRMPNGIAYAKLETLNVKLGSGGTTGVIGNTFQIDVSSGANLPQVTTVDGGISAQDHLVSHWVGDFNGKVSLTAFEYTTIAVDGNFNGMLSDLGPGTVQSVTIGGSMTATGSLMVGSLDLLSIGPMPGQLSPGHDLAGQVIVNNKLQTVVVDGGTPGTITAGTIGTISVYGGYAPLVTQINEAGIQRKIETAIPTTPYPLSPGYPNAPLPLPDSMAKTLFKFFYEGLASALHPINPIATIRITNSSNNLAVDQFDLSLVTYSDTAKFNLARVDAPVLTGVRNLVVEGDLLPIVSAAAQAFFGSTITTPAGVVVSLPADQLAAVSVRDYAPTGSVSAKSIQGIGFGSSTRTTTATVNKKPVITKTAITGAAATAADAAAILKSTTKIVMVGSTNVSSGVETVRVGFGTEQLATSTQPARKFGLFLDDISAGSFDPLNVVLVVQNEQRANAAGTANLTTLSNAARGAVTGLLTVAQTFNSKTKLLQSAAIENVAFRGDGAAIQTGQSLVTPVGATTKTPMSASITSTGTLGDVIIAGPLPSVNAGNIFGSLLPGGNIPATSIVQTTGTRIDPMSGAASTISGDLGRVYVSIVNKAPLLQATVVQSQGTDPLAGQIITQRNLVSTVNALSTTGITGQILTTGDLGTRFVPTSTSNAQLLGGIASSGPMNAPSVVLASNQRLTTTPAALQGGIVNTGGNLYGKIRIAGTMNGPLVSVSDNTGGTLNLSNPISGGSISTAGSVIGEISISGGVSGPAINVPINQSGTITLSGQQQGGYIYTGGSYTGNLSIGGSLAGPSISVASDQWGTITTTALMQGGTITTGGLFTGNLAISGAMVGPSVTLNSAGIPKNTVPHAGTVSLGGTFVGGSITTGQAVDGYQNTDAFRGNLAITGRVFGPLLLVGNNDVGTVTMPSTGGGMLGGNITSYGNVIGDITVNGAAGSNYTSNGAVSGPVISANSNVGGQILVNTPLLGGSLKISGSYTAATTGLSLGVGLSGPVVYAGSNQGGTIRINSTNGGVIEGGELTTLGKVTGNLKIAGALSGPSIMTPNNQNGTIQISASLIGGTMTTGSTAYASSPGTVTDQGNLTLNGGVIGPVLAIGTNLNGTLVVDHLLQGGIITTVGSMVGANGAGNLTIGGGLIGPVINPGGKNKQLTISAPVEGGEMITTGNVSANISLAGGITGPVLTATDNTQGTVQVSDVVKGGSISTRGSLTGRLSVSGSMSGPVITGTTNLNGVIRIVPNGQGQGGLSGGFVNTGGDLIGSVGITGGMSGPVVSETNNQNGELTITAPLSGGSLMTGGQFQFKSPNAQVTSGLTLGGSLSGPAMTIVSDQNGSVTVGAPVQGGDITTGTTLSGGISISGSLSGPVVSLNSNSAAANLEKGGTVNITDVIQGGRITTGQPVSDYVTGVGMTGNITVGGRLTGPTLSAGNNQKGFITLGVNSAGNGGLLGGSITTFGGLSGDISLNGAVSSTATSNPYSNGAMSGPMIIVTSNQNGSINIGTPVVGGSITTYGDYVASKNGMAIQVGMNGPVVYNGNNQNGLFRITTPANGGSIQGGEVTTLGSVTGNISLAGTLSGPTVTVPTNVSGTFTIAEALLGGNITTSRSSTGNIAVSGSITGPKVTDSNNQNGTFAISTPVLGGTIKIGDSTRGNIAVGGSISGPAVTLSSNGGGTFQVGPNVQGGDLLLHGNVVTGTPMGAITVGGSVTGASVVKPATAPLGTISVAPLQGGRIVSYGDLGSVTITGSVSGGTIAATGSIKGSLSVGTTKTSGSFSGDLISIGSILGNITINGSLLGGRMATQGSIDGNVVIIGVIDAQSAIISNGAIGKPKVGNVAATTLSTGNVMGIIAAKGAITVGKIGTTNTARYNLPNDTVDTTVIDSIFQIPAGSINPFDFSTSLDLVNLSRMVGVLNSITVVTINGSKRLSR